MEEEREIFNRELTELRGRLDSFGGFEAKRTVLEEYRLQSRGGVGIINIQTSDRNGKVVGMAYVSEDDEVMLISQQGMILRMKAGDVRVIGRATQGVRLIEMEEGDQVVAIAKLVAQDDEPVNGSTPAGGTIAAPETSNEVDAPETPDDESPRE